jgi:hypothetical protein
MRYLEWWRKGTDCRGRFVLVHNCPHEGNKTHHMVGYYGVILCGNWGDEGTHHAYE